MAHSSSSTSAPLRQRVLIISAVALLCLGIFIAVFLVSSSEPLQHSYVPLLLGASSFAGLLTLLNKLVLPRRVMSGGIMAVLSIVLVEGIAFLYLFMFLLLNSFGE
jgi:hypothetical protein